MERHLLRIIVNGQEYELYINPKTLARGSDPRPPGFYRDEKRM